MKFPQQLLAFWKKVPVGKRVLLVTMAVAVVIGGSMAYTRVTTPTYSVLYANVDDAQASSVLAKLDAKGIAHKMEGNGTRILVPADQLVAARIEMAAQGIGDRTMPAGWSLLDNQGLATSDARQKIDFQRALEGELAKTLMAMDAIDTAQVHLTLPEQPIYAGAASQNAVPSTASVVLALKRPLSADEVETVANLVASSVQGLTVNNITVASTDGTLLHAPGDNPGAGGTLTTSKAMKATQEFETAQSDRLTALARQLTLRPDASVVVRAELNFDETQVENETVDPTKQVPAAEHTLNETWTGTGSPTGGTVGVDGGPLPGGANGNGTYNKDEKTTTYEGGKTVIKTVQTPGSVKRLSVAVVVPFDENSAVDPTTLSADVSSLIGAAAGLDAARGDTIKVATVSAGAVPTTTTVAPTVTPVTSGLPIPVLAGVGGGIFLFMVVLLMKRKKSKKSKKVGKGATKDDDEQTVLESLPAMNWTPDAKANAEQHKAETASIRADLDRMANETPESLAALLSSWLTKG